MKSTFQREREIAFLHFVSFFKVSTCIFDCNKKGEKESEGSGCHSASEQRKQQMLEGVDTMGRKTQAALASGCCVNETSGALLAS